VALEIVDLQLALNLYGNTDSIETLNPYMDMKNAGMVS
jgi:hypothetical protein